MSFDHSDRLYVFYTTCPKCAREYGKNYVVILAEVKGRRFSVRLASEERRFFAEKPSPLFDRVGKGQ